MPTGAPGLMPRRSSYASVVSGAASVQGYNQPARSGAFSHLLNHPNDLAYQANYQQTGSHSRHDIRELDTDMHGNGGGYGAGSSSWGRSGQLPSFSSAFAPLMNGHSHEGYAGSSSDHFFVPSYLKGSRYVRKLEEAHHVRFAARRDAPSTHTSQPGSLSTSNSSANLYAKLAPSPRGMTYDLIERAPGADEDALHPLPSRWNNQDKYGGVEVQGDGLEVKYTGSRPSSERDHEASSIRADNPMPAQCGIYYFEVTILSRKREESSIGIGFASKEVPLSRPPGWEPESWAYHGDDGHSFCCQISGKHYGPPFTTGDVIGCGVNFRTGCAFFTKNGDNLGTAFREIKGKLFPCVGMKKQGEHIRVNFGQSPFIFDIDGMMNTEQTLVHEKVQKQSTAKLAPSLDETSLIQGLVLQYLSHDGYVETAKLFAGEVHAERQALSMDPDLPIRGFDPVKEDEEAVNRQRIRTAVLDGDVEKALKYTTAYYPNVLKDNEHIYFRLRSRKFIEMIRRAAEIGNATRNGGKNVVPNVHNIGNWYDDVVNHEMELDDAEPSSDGYEHMETESMNQLDGQAEYNRLLQETIEYGQELEAEFSHDPRREIKKSLQDAFALLAYEDPINSKEVAHLLKREGRVAMAEELNSAILVSLGKSPCAALERLIQQSTVLIEDLREGGGPGAVINVDDYMKPYSHYPHELRWH
ncbi:MAG: hypothetical protein M1818_004070 [Claussenomyces sp. TS43310]|nr:MAG: hypothetical protein M1818_004070 [Claussenomyces sp. TS43310]